MAPPHNPTANPNPTLSPPGKAPTLQALPELVDEIRDLLDKITGHWSELLILQDRRQDVRAAFDDLVNRNVFEQLKQALSNPGNHLQLDQAGLTGTQLNAKLGKGRSLWNKFWQFGGRKWLGRLLDWINKILGSISAALPGGEAIKELKELCEEELKDTD
jgi:hypothetical protein